MNKILNVFKKIFIGIYKLVDKYIVTPISKLVFIINDKLKNNGGKFEKILNKPYMLVYLSLIFAVGIFFLVDNKVVNIVQTEAEILVDQPINVLYNKEAYVIEGLPDTVDITLMGRKSDLYLAKQLGDHDVVLDLTEYGEGKHKVRLTLNQTINSLNYKLDPGVLTVEIKKRVSALKTVTSDLINQDKLDAKLSVKNIELSNSEVVVKGSAETLDKIASVKALIDLSNGNLTEQGKKAIDNVKLVAYDNTGNVMNNVDIVPSSITATVELSSYSIEVPLKINTIGDLKAGRAISSILVNGKDSYKVTIYGDQDVLETINSIPVQLDISNQGVNNKTYNVPLSKPSGVRYISESSVSITLEFGEESQKTIENVRLNAENNNDSYKVESDTIGISVQLKGVESVISKINGTDTPIFVYVDVANLGIGTHELEVKIREDDPRVTYLSIQKTVKIKISAAK